METKIGKNETKLCKKEHSLDSTRFRKTYKTLARNYNLFTSMKIVFKDFLYLKLDQMYIVHMSLTNFYTL